MKDYKVELYGWECHIKAKNISGDDFDMAVKFDDPHEVEEMLTSSIRYNIGEEIRE